MSKLEVVEVKVNGKEATTDEFLEKITHPDTKECVKRMLEEEKVTLKINEKSGFASLKIFDIIFEDKTYSIFNDVLILKRYGYNFSYIEFSFQNFRIRISIGSTCYKSYNLQEITNNIKKLDEQLQILKIHPEWMDNIDPETINNFMESLKELTILDYPKN